MFRNPLLALALVAALAPAALAQTVDEILAKHFEAQGGVEKLKKVQTWRMTGKMTLGQGMEAPLTIEKKRPDRTRLEFSAAGMTGIQAYDGKGGWQVMPFMGQTTPGAMSPDETKRISEQADFDGPLMDWKAKGHKLELAGKEPVEGADAFKLRLTSKGGEVTNYYLDAESFLVVKTDGKRTMRGEEVEAESFMSDYKEVAGILVAFTRTSGIKGSEHRQSMTFDKIEANVPIDDARFTMPAAAAAPPDSAKAAPPKDATPAPKHDK